VHRYLYNVVRGKECARTVTEQSNKRVPAATDGLQDAMHSN